MESQIYGYIYLNENLINHKVYIGKHQYPKRIPASKRKFLDPYYHGSGTAYNAAVNKYGKENFTESIIDLATSLEELNKKERWWIDIFKTELLDENTYNIAPGGDGGPDVSDWKWVRNPDTGDAKRIPSDQVDDFLATHPDWRSGRITADYRWVHNPDTGDAKMIPPDQLNNFLATYSGWELGGTKGITKGSLWVHNSDTGEGKIILPEQLDKFFETHPDWICGAVNQIDKKTGEIIATFDSSWVAAQETGIDRNQIEFAADYFKYPRGDYDWEWKDSRWRHRRRQTLRNARKVMCVETGEIFDNHVAAAVAMATKENRIDYQNIQACCKGIAKSAGGYHWKYAE